MIKEIIHGLTIMMELTGVLVIIGGAIISVYLYIKGYVRREADAYDLLRKRLGRSILLGLEFLVGGDIINTVAVEPTLSNVATLGMIVLIRTFLSFSLGLELEKRLPWQKSDK